MHGLSDLNNLDLSNKDTNTYIKQDLILSIIGTDQFNNLLPLFKLINEYGGNIITSRVNQFNTHYATILQINGKWDAITRIEEAIDTLEEELNSKIISQRVSTINNNLNSTITVIDKKLDNYNSPNKITKNSDKNIENNKIEDNKLEYLPYKISINNLDEPGLIEKIMEFFILQEVSIQELTTNSYNTEYGSKLAQIDIKIKIPSDIHIPSLREQFDVLCYNENLDARLFPVGAIS